MKSIPETLKGVHGRKSVPYLSDIGVERVLTAIGAYAASDGVGGYWVCNDNDRVVGAFGKDAFDAMLYRNAITWVVTTPAGRPVRCCWVLAAYAPVPADARKVGAA